MRPSLFVAFLSLGLGFELSHAQTVAGPVGPPAQYSAIHEDFERIAQNGGFAPGSLRVALESLPSEALHPRIPSKPESLGRIECTEGRITVRVLTGPAREWGAAAYYGLQKLGFLFPHPRWQVSPTWDDARLACGTTFVWRPRLEARGFHLHNMHPNEWVRGFLQGDQAGERIAQEMVRWLARNGQNVVQVVLLKTMNRARAFPMLGRLAEYSHQHGVMFGLGVTFALQQQKAWRLIDFRFPFNLLIQQSGFAEPLIRRSIRQLSSAINFDYLNIELGSSEFTSTSAERTLEWIATAESELKRNGKHSFYKIHASVNQTHPKYGNFNFLPAYASPTVGVLPHTVMFYALEDSVTPVYHRKSFEDMRDFMIAQSRVRPTWYYPETSYFIAMDIDVPLLLTDYLTGRSRDMDLLEREGVRGQVNFTTGQEVGYWLMDWTVALLANADHAGKPLVGLELLGEDVPSWQRMAQYQSEWFRLKQVIALISAANFLDESPVFRHLVHDRVIFDELKDQPKVLEQQISLLRQAIDAWPGVAPLVRDSELGLLMEVTGLRLQHSLRVREALLERFNRNRKGMTLALTLARQTRIEAQHLMKDVVARYNRYPEAGIYTQNRNLTSYRFGYGWTAATLHYWAREEEMIIQNRFDAFFRAVVNPLDVLL